MLEKEFPDKRGCCSEDYRKGRLARYWQHNLAPRDLTSPYPSMVLLYLPQEVGGVEFHCVWAWGCWGTSPTEKPTENTELFYFL
jgi:hypothetical protein